MFIYIYLFLYLYLFISLHLFIFIFIYRFPWAITGINISSWLINLLEEKKIILSWFYKNQCNVDSFHSLYGNFCFMYFVLFHFISLFIFYLF